MSKIQHFGIAYPFRRDKFQNFYVDTNNSTAEKVRSQLMHIVFTPKGQRCRMPEFGTDLIKYIFEPSDDESWGSIKNEIAESVSRWVPNCIINDIRVVEETNGSNNIHVRIDYSVKKGYITEDDSFIVTL